MHWIAGAAPSGRRFGAKTRYRMADARCTLEPLRRGDAARVRFDAPQWAPTPGQYLVLYDGETCLGGAVIESAHARERAPALAAAG